MKEYIKMVVVLTVIATVCGFLLATVRYSTEERIVEQVLLYVQGPAVNKVLSSSTNDLIQDRQEIRIQDQEHLVFVGERNDQPWAIAFESSAGGYGGDIGVLVGFDIEQDLITGIGILTHSETPGLGARVTESTFTDNFNNKTLNVNFNVKQDGGFVDAVTGATISSRAVCLAVRKSLELYPEIKKEIVKQ
ncbi:MAG: RnfABCDGE type electron transport complex subunit G [Candidatus Marinimicrobia bacterium]|nr:RnfABCDGE type electron transport complex subunit G [Candidatus Neomarinimicrobiota bacterium]